MLRRQLVVMSFTAPAVGGSSSTSVRFRVRVKDGGVVGYNRFVLSRSAFVSCPRVRVL